MDDDFWCEEASARPRIVGVVEGSMRLARPAPSPGMLPGPLFSDRIAQLGTENAFKIGPWIQALEADGHHVVRCNLGEPDFPLPRHVREEVKRALDADLTHYCDPQGILPLREAIARDVGARRGLEISPDRVVVFPGAKPPIGFCHEVYTNPGDEVVYPSPGFPIYESFATYLGCRPVPLHLEEEQGFTVGGPALERLLSARTKLVVLNFPSNPTGGVATPAQLERLADVLVRRLPPNARVYSDEVYEAIVFDGHTFRSIASCPGMEERTIVVGGVSKTYSWTGGRIGWAVFPTAEEAAVMKNVAINRYSCLPAYNQWGAKVAIESPESAPELARMVAAFQARRDAVVAGLNAIPGVRCQNPGGAFYVFPNVAGLCEALGVLDAHRALPPAARDATSPSTLLQRFLLFRHHLATLDRRSFGRIGAEGQHFLRLSIATAGTELTLGLERLARAGADRDGFAAFVREGRFLT
jgi:aspartate/methionine/tyrosine aminotransferase